MQRSRQAAIRRLTAKACEKCVLAALALGLLNAVVKPLLFWLTLPLTILTLGLFLVILNALMLEITAWLVRGFTINSFISALMGAIVLALVSLVTNRIGKSREA
ncbi:MAG TPA: phage holin family protein [Thermoanaerobaculia bacterium]|nr:phage holin family protein [Thermoanaerobaculia bacterium]